MGPQGSDVVYHSSLAAMRNPLEEFAHRGKRMNDGPIDRWYYLCLDHSNSKGTEYFSSGLKEHGVGIKGSLIELPQRT